MSHVSPISESYTGSWGTTGANSAHHASCVEATTSAPGHCHRAMSNCSRTSEIDSGPPLLSVRNAQQSTAGESGWETHTSAARPPGLSGVGPALFG